MVSAQMKTAQELTAFAERHKAVMQSQGQIQMVRGGKQSFMVSGKDLVSVVKAKEQISFYTETSTRKIHSLMNVTAGRQEKEIVVHSTTKSLKAKEPMK